LKKKPEIIVITGAESTGKSTLTEQLANHFNVPFIPEIAREYVENLSRKYNYEDVENIAKLQAGKLNELKNLDIPYIFCDTWLIITKVWFEVVFRKVPDWVEEEIRKTKIDLFLLCDTDLPWIADPVRENGGENRLKLQNIYKENIEKYSFSYKVVNGTNSERIENALKFIEELKQSSDTKEISI
jgi:NadR type nicotinamide-nucleotide adenylyltransferase